MTDAIAVSGLVKSFGAKRALDGFDLTVRTGEVHGFLGPNGAGKSTTIRVLLGLLRADAGDVRLLGGDPWRDAVALHRRLAYVPGEVNLWPNLSGGESIDVLGRLRGGLDPARRDALIERFELDPRIKGRAYSKGNRQKVALVAALAADVELLLMDEPTSGLDPLMEAVFQQVVQEAAADGRTVLLSSHILAEVEALCRRVTIIRQGRAVQSGSLEELRSLTRTTVTAGLRDADEAERTLDRARRRAPRAARRRPPDGRRRHRLAQRRARAAHRVRRPVADRAPADPRGPVPARVQRGAGHSGRARGVAMSTSRHRHRARRHARARPGRAAPGPVAHGDLGRRGRRAHAGVGQRAVAGLLHARGAGRPRAAHLVARGDRPGRPGLRARRLHGRRDDGQRAGPLDHDPGRDHGAAHRDAAPAGRRGGRPARARAVRTRRSRRARGRGARRRRRRDAGRRRPDVPRAPDARGSTRSARSRSRAASSWSGSCSPASPRSPRSSPRTRGRPARSAWRRSGSRSCCGRSATCAARRAPACSRGCRRSGGRRRRARTSTSGSGRSRSASSSRPSWWPWRSGSSAVATWARACSPSGWAARGRRRACRGWSR